MAIHESENCTGSCSTQGNGGYTRNRGGNVEHQVGYRAYIIEHPPIFNLKITSLEAWTCAVYSNKIQNNRINAQCNSSTKKNMKLTKQYLEMPLFEITQICWNLRFVFHCFLHISFQTHIVTSQSFVDLHIAPLVYFLSQWRIHWAIVVYGPSVRN